MNRAAEMRRKRKAHRREQALEFIVLGALILYGAHILRGAIG